MSQSADARTRGAGIVLFTLASGQFLMTLDSSVMNVSIAQVAEDLGTTVTGVQTAITLYTLVMATCMITGGKIGSIIGRRRAFAIGCVIYGAGSLTTALSPNLTVLIIGWSGLEGLGAALIMPAIVALVAANFRPADRPRAYGLVASAGAIAVAAGPLIGGAVTTYWTWRLVFAGEVVIVAAILLLTRRIQDAAAPDTRPRIDVVGALLSAAGLGFAVFGILRSGEWGWVLAKDGGPGWLGLSPTVWLVVGGLVILRVFFSWERRVERRGGEPLVSVDLLRNSRLVGGLTMFFFQFLVQAGLFFCVPLFLSIALGLSALDTGLRLLPLSVALLLAAVGIPRFFPTASPRRVVSVGLGAILVGIIALVLALDAGAGPEIVSAPLLLVGLGVGALSSQLGAVTVSAVPDEQSGDVGGIQNTMTNLGASIGTALAGSILIAGLTTSFMTGIADNAAVPDTVSQQAEVELSGGIPFISDAQLDDVLSAADVPDDVAAAVVDENTDARIAGLRLSLVALALITVLALYFTRMLPTRPVGRDEDARTG